MITSALLLTMTGVIDIFGNNIDDNKDYNSEVLGAESESPEKTTKITLEDNGQGNLDIFMNLPYPTRIAGFKLFLEAKGSDISLTDLKIKSLSCSEDFDCSAKVTSENIIHVSGAITSENTEEYLRDKVKLITVTYDPLTDGKLVLNGIRTDKSEIIEAENGTNILDMEPMFYEVGEVFIPI
ncbi:hypothetical protein JW710_04000 [Candidatus Dojkabacteria bacterium]|nr:hypothetical protein [Candidatus Dojkabacteria bacterium]